jgi:N utilization substance protein B
MTQSTQTPKTPEETHASKRLARLAAVQALYQIAYEQQSPAQTMKDFIDQAFASLDDDVEPGVEKAKTSPDSALFCQIVQGVVDHQAALDEMLAGALSEKISSARLELLLRSVLRAGVFELLHHSKIPEGVIINDYVDVTRSFFNAREPGMVNAVLDKLAKKLRT